VPILVALGGFAATFALSIAIHFQERAHIRRVVSGEAEAASRAIQSAVTAHVQSLARMVTRWELSRPAAVDWQHDARMLLEQSYGFEVIEWVNSSFETRWSVHTGGKKSIDADAAFGEPHKDALKKARDRRGITVTRAIGLPHGGTGIMIYAPIFLSPAGDSFDGFIAAVLNLHSTMTGLLDVNFVRRYDIEIVENGQAIYVKPGAREETKKEWAREIDSKLYGVFRLGSPWTVRVWPQQGWLKEIDSSLDWVVLAAGLMSSGLLALLVYFFQLARSHEQLLETTNASLTQEITEREHAQAALADFTALIVHDLRSPLSNVISILEGMREGLFGSVAPDQSKWLERAENTTRGSVELVSDFLDMSKLEAGRIGLKRQPVNLAQLLKASLDKFSLAATEKSVSLRDEIDCSLPSVEVDPRRLEQVMDNLLSNALKFTPNGGEIVVGASWTETEIKVWVRDTGVGIPPAEIGQIFEKYRQTTSGIASEQKGTGLGLVICKMIVEGHGGNIRVQSERGTTFTFTLPRG
jgi:signal transduction histidine kinase